MLRSTILAIAAVLSNVAYGALTYKGADISSLIMLENQGKTFKTTAGVTQPLECMLIRHHTVIVAKLIQNR
jgi:arabinogalactan endo-1,4-beta-galactosidase